MPAHDEGDDEHRGRCPSLQGRNPREVGTKRAADAMGISASPLACTGQAAIAARSNAASDRAKLAL